ncbi:penicillin-binding protein 2 [Alteromonas sediminis]|uniref:Peptidoglycan D,D-transpeptidase MrdA n=1 Tax=Alteromonas sediminis TaxID=2259342 RepID=A0A3N5YR16_9ALTE|nr:penicillin-binding protein 2 [Alteromonas sediminis]RPJ68781.1 penicillin-binding protein 2 [Alteromonas sediminis]
MPIKRQTIRDHTAEANLVTRRAFIAFIITSLLLGVVLSNLYVLQVKQHQDFETRSDTNRIKVLPVAPNRGLIYDRNGVLLAENQPVFSLELIPEDIDDLDTTLSQLKALFPITEEDISSFKQTLRGQRRFKPIALKTRLSEQEVAIFSANKYRFPGVSIEARLSRHYPYAGLLTHVLGYVSKINKKDLQKLIEAGQEDNYAATYDIGKLGVERFHESLLHGKVGYQQVEVNSQGRIIRTLEVQPPTPGQDIVLNIDLRLQQKAAELLGDRRGTVVMTDPSTGGVLALYSSPSYDPNMFVHGISQANYSALLNSTDRPLINRATQGQYPPASTIKPHLGLVGLEHEVITPDEEMTDYGRYRLPNVSHVWRDWKRGGHGKVNLTKAIEVSCDTFYYDLAYRTGIDKISESMMDFGFGDYTGIDLHEESAANMPSRGWKKARFNEPWYIGDTIPVGIGQSFWTATPVQIAQSVNTLINKGERFIPQIKRGYIENEQITVELPKTLRPVAMKKEANWDLVLDAMYGTVNRDHGTAFNAFATAPYVSAGKTGTAQLFSVAQDEEYEEENVAEHLRDNAMYVGYAPYDAPQVSIAVVIENAGGGSSNAAPVARAMFDYYFTLNPLPEDKWYSPTEKRKVLEYTSS